MHRGGEDVSVLVHGATIYVLVRPVSPAVVPGHTVVRNLAVGRNPPRRLSEVTLDEKLEAIVEKEKREARSAVNQNVGVAGGHRGRDHQARTGTIEA